MIDSGMANTQSKNNNNITIITFLIQIYYFELLT